MEKYLKKQAIITIDIETIPSETMPDIETIEADGRLKDEEKIQAIVGPAKKVEMIGDGYYTRALTKVDKRITKRIFKENLY